MPAGLKEAAVIRKLKKYTPTPFKAKDSAYDKQAADNFSYSMTGAGQRNRAARR